MPLPFTRALNLEMENAKGCNACPVIFGFRKYRYHCAQCAKSYCNDHASSYRNIAHLDVKKKVRLCKDCDHMLEHQHTPASETIIRDIKEPKNVYNRSILPTPNGLSPRNTDYDSMQLMETPPSSAMHSSVTNSMSYRSYSSGSSVRSSLSEPAGECSPCSSPKKPFEMLPVTLDIVTYNVWMMPDRVTAFARSVSPNKHERAIRIALEMPKVDVVMFQEAFCIHSRSLLLEAMAQQGYLYRSPVVGRVQSGIRPLDGGVVLVSKFPIVTAETRKFGQCCTGDDRLSDKGILYVRILKNGVHINIFGTHTQAWDYPKAVRVRHRQFQLLHKYIQDCALPPHEIVLIAGDLNVDKFDPGEPDDPVPQHASMLEALDCAEGDSISSRSKTRYSFDSELNHLAAPGLSSDGSCELLDYILYSKSHRKPQKAITWVHQLQSTTAWRSKRKGKLVMTKDLSDHYPVVAKYTF